MDIQEIVFGDLNLGFGKRRKSTPPMGCLFYNVDGYLDYTGTTSLTPRTYCFRVLSMPFFFTVSVDMGATTTGANQLNLPLYRHR